MGWLWNSGPTKDTPSELPKATTPPTIPEIQSTPKKLTPDEQADLEFNQLLADLRKADTELNAASGSTSTNENGTPTSSIAPESLYADTMSCRTAFDYAFFCQSFGGQFVNVYRYGELRSCSEHWDNFWLCMKTRGWSDELRRKTIRDHNRKKAIKYKTGPSSEDIWDVRLDPASDSFKGDFVAMEREMKAEEEAQKQKNAA
ncbi:uncharacterized protein N7483_007898 [Penicillium malachiteum]|uniref:uncharacterized protein n=1 Tax=Penicillium malachiteum TaxID=1324776 RepID=UPI002547C52C|nr:uncharacterized protein N7483_007898 [Penicillium malachiteum]KAJ5726541.1 hypothetical protein N7483_007898 [Penicillium malachiteum]